MLGIRGAHLKYQSKFTRLDGLAFYGQILDIPDTSRVSNFLSARRFLRVSTGSIIRAADVIYALGTRYILGNHGTGILVTPLYKHFKMFQVDLELPWSRNTDVVDAVTGITKSGARSALGTAFISLDTKNDIEDSLQIQTERKVFITDKDVKVEDYLGTYIVTKVDKLLGISICEVKETY